MYVYNCVYDIYWAHTRALQFFSAMRVVTAAMYLRTTWLPQIIPFETFSPWQGFHLRLAHGRIFQASSTLSTAIHGRIKKKKNTTHPTLRFFFPCPIRGVVREPEADPNIRKYIDPWFSQIVETTFFGPHRGTPVFFCHARGNCHHASVDNMVTPNYTLTL